jgi:hypothetical protein
LLLELHTRLLLGQAEQMALLVVLVVTVRHQFSAAFPQLAAVVQPVVVLVGLVVLVVVLVVV